MRWLELVGECLFVGDLSAVAMVVVKIVVVAGDGDWYPRRCGKPRRVTRASKPRIRRTLLRRSSSSLLSSSSVVLARPRPAAPSSLSELSVSGCIPSSSVYSLPTTVLVGSTEPLRGSQGRSDALRPGAASTAVPASNCRGDPPRCRSTVACLPSRGKSASVSSSLPSSGKLEDEHCASMVVCREPCADAVPLCWLWWLWWFLLWCGKSQERKQRRRSGAGEEKERSRNREGTKRRGEETGDD